MLIDFVGCWIIEIVCKYLFADLAPKPIVTRGKERREARRLQEKKEKEKEERRKVEERWRLFEENKTK